MQTPSGRTEHCGRVANPVRQMQNIADGVANPVRQNDCRGFATRPKHLLSGTDKTLRTGLQTPSGRTEHCGRVANPVRQMQNIADGVANPVRQMQNIADEVANLVRQMNMNIAGFTDTFKASPKSVIISRNHPLPIWNCLKKS